MSAVEYTRHAYARAILADLQRYLLDTFVEGEPQVKALVCEDVFYTEREVTPDAVMSMVGMLARLEDGERAAMRQFELTRRAAGPVLHGAAGIVFGDDGLTFEDHPTKEPREQEAPEEATTEATSAKRKSRQRVAEPLVGSENSDDGEGTR